MQNSEGTKKKKSKKIPMLCIGITAFLGLASFFGYRYYLSHSVLLDETQHGIRTVIYKDGTIHITGKVDYYHGPGGYAVLCLTDYVTWGEYKPFVKKATVDVENAVSYNGFFSGCTSLKEVDVSGTDTREVTTCSYMFHNCYKLEKVTFGSFDTSKITNMSGMFKCCYALETVDLSSFDTSNVVNYREMFTGCKSLEKLDVSNLSIGKAPAISGMFDSKVPLKELDLRSWDFSVYEGTDLENEVALFFDGLNPETKIIQ